MKGLVASLIVVGSLLLVGGGTVFAIGVARANKDANVVTKEYPIEGYSNVNIDLQTADLEFKVSTDGTRKVVCVEREKRYHTVNVENDTLVIKGFDSRKWYENVFSFDWKPMSVTVYAPSEAYNEGVIKTDTGNIVIPSDYTFDKLNVEASTGNINVKSNVTTTTNVKASTGNVSLEMKTKNLTVNTSTGDVDLNKVDVEEKAIINTSTGHIHLTETKAQNMELKASTGNVKLINTIVEENMNIKTSTGDVRFDDSDANVLIEVKTSTGDVEGTLLTGKNFQLSTHTGYIKPVESVTGLGTCKVTTDTGNIKLSVK